LKQRIWKILVALWGAFWGKKLSYPDNEINPSSAIKEIKHQLRASAPTTDKAQLKAAAELLAAASDIGSESGAADVRLHRVRELLAAVPAQTTELRLNLAKTSLAEVKSQTEYQDAKAARLLTIVAFVTAAVGMLFGKFIDLYPLHHSFEVGGRSAIIVELTYGSIGVYLILIACGAMIIFHATATRFIWPTEPDGADPNKVRSVLFFQHIGQTSADSWGKVFASDSDTLLQTYYECFVAETYLVSVKVSDKVRYLDSGQKILLSAIRVLLIAFLLTIITFIAVEPTKPVAVPSPKALHEFHLSRPWVAPLYKASVRDHVEGALVEEITTSTPHRSVQ